MIEKSRLDYPLAEDEDSPRKSSIQENILEGELLEDDSERELPDSEDLPENLPEKEPSKRYATITDILRAGRRKGINIVVNSLKWRIDHGKIASIRDTEDCKKRRLVPVEEVPGIIDYYLKSDAVRRGKYRTLADISETIGLKAHSLSTRAISIGIATFKIGTQRALTKTEYLKWRLILNRKKSRQEDYVSTGFIGKQFGVSHYLIIYQIKTGRIPAQKIDNHYRVPRAEFLEHCEEWRIKCGYGGNVKV